jgi:hypothetical protein
MWPLNLFFLFATAAPQPKPLEVFQDFHPLKLPVVQRRQSSDDATARRLIEESQRNTCFTIRSYFFRRQDGQAPVPAGMSTCTPASVLQQRQVSPDPRVRFVPLGAQRDEQ